MEKSSRNGWKEQERIDAMKQKRRTVSGSNLLLALIGTVFLLAGSVVLVLNLRPIYYFDIGFLHLGEAVGMEDEILRENYDVLIDYNLFWKGIDTLEFPDFPMSEHGRIHFEEVRRIFVAIQYAMIGSFAVCLIGLWGKCRRKDYGSLKLLSALAVLIPAVAGCLIAWNWQAFFVGFHHLMFSNDYWLFDPATDPIILVLPDEFFFQCAAVILVCVVFGSVCAGVAYRVLEKRNLKHGWRNET